MFVTELSDKSAGSSGQTAMNKQMRGERDESVAVQKVVLLNTARDLGVVK